MDDEGSGILFFIALLIAINIIIPSDKKIHKYFIEEMEDNENKYEADIDEYNKSIDDYAEYISSLNLTDIEVIMKIISDEWEEYKYESPEEMIVGYYRLSLEKEKKGVCREFADDFTSKINAINKEYNASNLFCYADVKEVDENTKIVDINREVNEESFNTPLLLKALTKKYGNHVVSIINIPNEDYMLVVDPVNLLIGVVDDGEIYIFNDSNEKGILNYKYPSNYIFGGNDYVKKEVINTNIDESVDYLEKLYGYNAQKEALKSIEEKEKVYIK